MQERKEGEHVPKRILHVEDDPMVARALHTTAWLAGNETVIVKTPEEAREHLECGGFDFVVTDGLDGRWASVCNIGDELGIRVVVLSGRAPIIEAARERGFEAILKTTEEDECQKT